MSAAPPESSAPLIEISRLTCCFGSKRALDDVSLAVPKGGVFGLVGENGAGKTTLIRHILGLFQPGAGSVRVFGLDPVLEPVPVLSRIGYLSEYRDLPLWMRIDELLRYSQAFYPSWDVAYAEQLRGQLGLDPAARVKTLSQGQQAKAGLLVALAFRPDLLVLDEPSSGLDPVVRRDLLEVIIRSVGEEGRTVFFSSHLLDEVERVSDRVAMIHQGRIVLCDTLAGILRGHSHCKLRFDSPPKPLPPIDGLLHAEVTDRDWRCICAGSPDACGEKFRQLGATVLEQRAASLDEIFLARAGHRDE